MDSSVDQETSGIVDSMVNAISTGITGAGVTQDGGSGCCLYVGDESDDSLTGSLKRKYGSESGNGDSNEDDDDDSVPIVNKLRKLDTPILVEPIRTVKFSELENYFSPDSVKVEALPFLMPPMENFEYDSEVKSPIKSCRQFWKAGDYERNCVSDPFSSSVGMDHVRVHPKFLHSNATSHKWALGAFAELLDNSLDEVCNGATYVHIDMLRNQKDGSRMLLIEDDGGGMCPDKMRSCVSLGYSSKRNMPNTIGQYGNGFKTSTMRLGADVLVFSRWKGSDQRRPTQSIGMLSYTFLRDTEKEDIVVPMVDFEFKENCWNKMMRSENDWNKNLETIAQWSPYSTQELLEQFNFLKENGTRIIIYNLWEDDEGHLELDFDADSHDIQIRGANRDEKNIKMAQQHPNSRHYLTYRHSLRIYASILYLRLPLGFRIILRGKDVEHHSIVDDLMLTKQITYRPNQLPPGTVQNRSDMSVMVTIGFVKDAQSHIDVQGYNVYHKNRLIKPFWRIWNPAGSDGRGVIGVLEANFIEPAHDKQGFEKTIVLSRLESRLVQIQKDYWRINCHEVGYAARRRSTESQYNNMDNLNSRPNQNGQINSASSVRVSTQPGMGSGSTTHTCSNQPLIPASTGMVNQVFIAQPQPQPLPASTGRVNPVFVEPKPQPQPQQVFAQPQPHPQPQPPVEQAPVVNLNGTLLANNEEASLKKMIEEQSELEKRLTNPLYVSRLVAYLRFERDTRKTLESKIELSSAEIMRKDDEILNLRNSLWGASTTIIELRRRITQLENSNTLSTSKTEPNDLAQGNP